MRSPLPPVSWGSDRSLTLLGLPLLVQGENLNYAFAIFAFVTVGGAVSWWFVPEDHWLARRELKRIHDAGDGHVPAAANGEASTASTASGAADKVDKAPKAAVH